MPKHFALFAILPILFLKISGYAQTPAASPQRTIWSHNGSVMYLVANGSSREFYYEKPLPEMLKAGARPGSLLFRGEVNNGQYSGTAYIFNPRCGQMAFRVRGAILDNDERIVLMGQAPRLGRNCKAYAVHTGTLEFRLLKSASTETQSSDNQETKPDVSSIDSKMPSTSTAQPSAAHDRPSSAKDQSGNIARQPLGIPTPEPSPNKKTVWDLDSYVLTGAYVVLSGALLFFLANRFYKKSLWRNRGFY